MRDLDTSDVRERVSLELSVSSCVHEYVLLATADRVSVPCVMVSGTEPERVTVGPEDRLEEKECVSVNAHVDDSECVSFVEVTS